MSRYMAKNHTVKTQDLQNLDVHQESEFMKILEMYG